MGGELHVSKTVAKMLQMREFEEEYVVCHCNDARRSLFSNSSVNSFIVVKFTSKNCVEGFKVFLWYGIENSKGWVRWWEGGLASQAVWLVG